VDAESAPSVAAPDRDVSQFNARAVAQMFNEVARCCGWLSLDVATGRLLAQEGAVCATLRRLASDEWRRTEHDGVRRVRGAGGYRDVLSVRVSRLGVMTLLARRAERPRFESRILSALRAVVAESVAPRSQRAAEVDSAFAWARRRAPASVLVVNRDLDVIWTALTSRCRAVLEELDPRSPHRRLLPAIRAALRDVLATIPHGCEDDLPEVVVPSGEVVLRVVPMHGSAGACFGVLVESSRTVSGIRAAAAKFLISERELQVVCLLMKGSSAEEIARELRIAETTVAAHVRSIMTKTSSRNRTEAVAKLVAQAGALA
jgi:DNA-binding CsgD family transcriptional regulator